MKNSFYTCKFIINLLVKADTIFCSTIYILALISKILISKISKKNPDFIESFTMYCVLIFTSEGRKNFI